MLLLTAADSADDFDGVTVGKLDRDELAAGNNLSIAFDRNAFTLQPEIADQVRHDDRGFELTRLSINAEPNHLKNRFRVFEDSCYHAAKRRC